MNQLQVAARSKPANFDAGRSRVIDLGTLQLPIPSWCIPLFGIVAVLYVALTLLSSPIQQLYTSYQSGKTELQDQLEAFNHFSDSPTAQVNKVADSGVLDAKLYKDGCISVSWRSAGSNDPPRPHFIRAAAKSSGPPPEPPRASLLVAPDAVGAGLVPLAGAAGKPQGAPATGCGNAHPGTFDTSYGSRNGCWVQVQRRFSDGCQHYQWFDSCRNVWDVNQDGSPKVHWTACRH